MIPITHSTSRRNSVVSPPQSPPQPNTENLSEIGIDPSTLPSRGIPYPQNSSIRYRPYTFGEIKKFSDSKNLTRKQSMDLILSGITTDFDVHDLTLNDTLYLGLLRKISTLGDRPLTAEYSCGVCGHKGQHTFELSQIEFHDLKAEALPAECDLSRLPNVQFMPLTVKAFIAMEGRTGLDPDLAAIAASCISHPFEEVYEALSLGSLDDVELLSLIDTYLEHHVKPVVIHCSACKKGKISLEVDGGDTIFMPFRKSQEPAANRIRFGSKNES